MAPTLAAVGCEMLRFETGEAVERSPRNRMLVRKRTVVNFLGERHCGSRGEYSTKGSQYRATPRISLPRRDSFFSQTKSCLSGSVHETFPDTIVTNLAGSLSRWIPCGRERCYSSTDPQIGPHTMKFGLGVIKSRSCQIECWQSSRA